MSANEQREARRRITLAHQKRLASRSTQGKVPEAVLSAIEAAVDEAWDAAYLAGLADAQDLLVAAIAARGGRSKKLSHGNARQPR